MKMFHVLQENILISELCGWSRGTILYSLTY